jgi:hypothetical protein
MANSGHPPGTPGKIEILAGKICRFDPYQRQTDFQSTDDHPINSLNKSPTQNVIASEAKQSQGL